MITLELHQIDLRYRDLRIRDAARQSRLAAELAKDGQSAPVLVVPGAEAGRYVLIDGYGRFEALRSLSRDTIGAVVLDVAEAEALVLRHRLAAAPRRTALEEGWFVAALMEVHGWRPLAIALALGKTPSWVSRRLALVTVLPDAVQDAVRKGEICAHGAEKYLVPLARANAAGCTRLVAGLAGTRPTVRQLGRLYAAWRGAEEAVRARILENPTLYLKAEEATRGPDDEDLGLLTDIEALAGAGARARRRLREGGYLRLSARRRTELRGAWREAHLVLATVTELLRQEGVDVGSGHADGGAAAEERGPRDASNRQDVGDLARLGQGDSPRRTCGSAGDLASVRAAAPPGADP